MSLYRYHMDATYHATVQLVGRALLHAVRPLGRNTPGLEPTDSEIDERARLLHARHCFAACDRDPESCGWRWWAKRQLEQERADGVSMNAYEVDE